MLRETAILVLAFSALTAAAEEPIVNVTVNPYHAHVGDPTEITITVRALAANSITIAEMPAVSGDLIIQGSEMEERRDLLGIKIVRRTIRCVPFAVGSFTIPELAVEIIGKDGKSFKTTSPTALLLVHSIAAAEEGPDAVKGLKGIIAPQEKDTTVNTFMFIALIIVLLAIGAVGTWYFLFRRTPASVRQLLKLTPAQRALKDLSELMSSELLRKGRIKQFYTELADIVRRYLGLRYHIMALEMTSTELCVEMAGSWEEDGMEVIPLSQLLESCDLVKFAKFQPPQTKGAEGIETARKIVITTRDDLQTEDASSKKGMEKK